MWPPLPAAPGPAAAPAAPPPAPGPQALGGAGGAEPPEGRGVYIREFRAAEQEAARRIFYDGIMERIPNTAFRGLRQHPRAQLLYALLAALCFALTRSLLLTCLVPAGLLALRYYYSRKVVLAYLDCALHTDMADIEQYYMKPPGSCFWVAVLDGNVVGIVAARANAADNTVELLRMSVDSRFRGRGIAKALGRKVLEFALAHHYSAVVLGTTAVKAAAHKLYESLGFRHMGSSDRHVMPGMTLSLAERLFFQVRYHRYRLQLREE
ncbi:N-acetylaspartate synthetase, partial [Oryx dammah]|uniref:N-acetylaspartate synthetase n=1 Tax=Oryx dammah TaxID=59534 RepID=UPI001A9B4337